MFDAHLRRWNPTIDGAPSVTATSALLPVTSGDTAAMLKAAVHAEEKCGNQLMVWWDGRGAARVLAHGEDAILMERADAGISLADSVRDGRDDEASRVNAGTSSRVGCDSIFCDRGLCGAVARRPQAWQEAPWRQILLMRSGSI
jgi:streptomycin 6-kinase